VVAVVWSAVGWCGGGVWLFPIPTDHQNVSGSERYGEEAEERSGRAG